MPLVYESRHWSRGGRFNGEAEIGEMKWRQDGNTTLLPPADSFRAVVVDQHVDLCDGLIRLLQDGACLVEAPSGIQYVVHQEDRLIGHDSFYGPAAPIGFALFADG